MRRWTLLNNVSHHLKDATVLGPIAKLSPSKPTGAADAYHIGCERPELFVEHLTNRVILGKSPGTIKGNHSLKATTTTVSHCGLRYTGRS
jgi:hypothetical protein